MCVGYLCGLDSGISPYFQPVGGSCEHRSIEKSTECVQSGIFATCDLPFLHKYTLEGSGCETECVRGTCVDFSPTHLYVCSRLAQVESIKAAKSRLRVYKRTFFATLDLLFLHKHTCNGSGCETECV